MKHLIYYLVYICLGVFAILGRTSLKSSSDIVTYMSIVNQIAGFVTLIMIYYRAFIEMSKKSKKENKRLKHLNCFVLCFFISILIYWSIIVVLYHIFDPANLNDSVTIITLVFALTDDLWSCILQTIFY